jgi:hypothetical protein
MLADPPDVLCAALVVVELVVLLGVALCLLFLTTAARRRSSPGCVTALLTLELCFVIIFLRLCPTGIRRSLGCVMRFFLLAAASRTAPFPTARPAAGAGAVVDAEAEAEGEACDRAFAGLLLLSISGFRICRS